MAHENRIHQLENIANRSPQHEGKWDALAAGEMSVSSSQSGTTYLVPVPVTLKAQLGSPTALAIGAFSTTLATLGLALMEFRGLTITNVFIGNFFFVAGIGMVISAQWELVLGNTYAYTVLSAFGFFYGGFGAIITPLFGVQAAYGTDTAAYNNALGFFVLNSPIPRLPISLRALKRVNKVAMGSLASSPPSHPATDPAVYDAHHQGFNSSPVPSKPEEWLHRAARVSAILAEDAAHREKENKSPIAEVSLLKSSGLTKVIGPQKYGGGGQGWDVAYKVIREIAKADGSIGMLLGYHLLWSWTANVVGTDEQKDRTQKLIIVNNYFIGGAVNPRDNDQKITDDGDHIVFSGFKHFNTGGVVSDLTVLEGVYEGTDEHIFALAETNQPAIVFSHNWDNIGLRLTESGSVKIDNVRVPWTDALGWNPTSKKPIEIGALSFASTYTTKYTRPWPYTPSPASSATSEPYILARYGSFFAHLRAAEALADLAGTKISEIYTHHSTKRDITAAQRGEIAEWVASVKVVATDTALRVTGGVFETTGARATAGKVGLDRYWRDVRTHTLHDPVSYKETELGRYPNLEASLANQQTLPFLHPQRPQEFSQATENGQHSPTPAGHNAARKPEQQTQPNGHASTEAEANSSMKVAKKNSEARGAGSSSSSSSSSSSGSSFDSSSSSSDDDGARKTRGEKVKKENESKKKKKTKKMVKAANSQKNDGRSSEGSRGGSSSSSSSSDDEKSKSKMARKGRSGREEERKGEKKDGNAQVAYGANC
ncbi:MAG: hypothetical protein ASARMPREDX12_001145 [Alectoria sarmentosa]|nr:MAG: hypothetical protein ASARMPREDX12_001145 [Alectoria sarmentosa]